MDILYQRSTVLEIIIVTKDDTFYEFDRTSCQFNNNSFIAFCDDFSLIEPIIKDHIVEELCNKGVIDIRYTSDHVYALTCDGKVYEWEHNRLTNKNDTLRRHKPKLNEYLSDKYITSLSCGTYYTLALTANGDVYDIYWKDSIINYHGFDGDQVIAISCGSEHLMALTKRGTVYSWGNNNWGQLGTGRSDKYSSRIKYSPKLIIMDNISIVKISCGAQHSLLLSSDGDIYVSGLNEWGQLGTNSENQNLFNRFLSYLKNKKYKNVLKPKLLSHPKKFSDIATHYSYGISSAVSREGIYYVWGECGKNNVNLQPNEVIINPKETKFKSFNEVFENYLQITYKPDDSLRNFEDYSTQNNWYTKYFLELEKLGEGSFGEVFKVKAFSRRIEFSAVKKIELKNPESDILNEFKIFPVITNLKDKHIAEYYEIWLEYNDSKNSTKKLDKTLTLFIRMELCDGTVSDIMIEIEKNLKFQAENCLNNLGYYIASEIFIQMLKGVKYLHKQNIIHRDLNPNNILLKFEENCLNFVKIADLGLSAVRKYGVPFNSEDRENIISAEVLHTADRGALKYMAPEVEEAVLDYDNTKAKYNNKADIYSLGIILQDLFGIDTDRDYMSADNQTILLGSKYESAKILGIRMTNNYPINRPDCDDILKNIDSMALSAGEFTAREEFEKVLETNRNSNSLLYKLLECRKNIIFKMEI